MRVYRSPTAASLERSPEVVRAVTVGYFDGVHIGHQSLLEDLREWAARKGASPAAVTFDRHPLEVLRGVCPLPILSLTHRLLLLAGEGMEATLVLTFSKEIASWSPEEFVRRALIESLGAKHVLMGFDSAWGHRRRGTFEYLSERAESLGIDLRQSRVRRMGGVRASSSLVREAVAAGDLDVLRGVLGRPYSLLGTVVPGDGRGRTLGFPTANLDVAGETVLPSGVYFAEVSRWGRLESAAGDTDADPGEASTFALPRVPLQPERIGAVVNIGERPTFATPERQATVEVHLLDFEGDLYGEALEVHVLERRRAERKFSSRSELVAEIERDVAAFREWRRGMTNRPSGRKSRSSE